MSTPAGHDISAHQRIAIDGTSFITGFAEPTDDAFTLIKSPSMVERYRDLLTKFERPRMMELGIAFGGSVALLSLLADPSMFVAVELAPDAPDRLKAFIDGRGLADRVRTHFGVDQADRAALRQIVRTDFGGRPIDLILDDASHEYAPTRASFEVLFPLLRPGGLYVIEDWKWQHEVVLAMLNARNDPSSDLHHTVLDLEAKYRNSTPPPPADIPLSRLSLELVLAKAESTGAIERVSVDEHWILVERGDGPLNPETFALADLAIDHYRQLTPTQP